MSEIYEAWRPLASIPLPLSFSFKAMNLYSNTLVLDFAAPTNKEFGLAFTPIPISMSICNESFRLRTLSSLPNPRQGSIYIVKNSSMLERFHIDSLGIYLKDPIFHLAIVTDEWIDLLTTDFPCVTKA